MSEMEKTQTENTVYDESSIDTLDDTKLDKLIQSDTLSKPEEEEKKPEESYLKESEKENEKETSTPSELDNIKSEIIQLKEEIEKKDKRLKDKDDFINRRNIEIGLLRKELKPLDKEALREKFMDDPIAAHNEIEAHKAKERQIKDAEFNYQIEQTRQFVTEKIPNFNDLVNDMAVIAKQDGVSDNIIAQFKQDPFSLNDSPAVLLNLAHRAKMKQELDLLKQENEKLKTKPDEMLKKIENATTQTKAISGATSGTASQNNLDSLTYEQLSNLSDSELDAILSKFG